MQGIVGEVFFSFQELVLSEQIAKYLGKMYIALPGMEKMECL